jgi:hypothetical protein
MENQSLTLDFVLQNNVPQIQPLEAQSTPLSKSVPKPLPRQIKPSILD